MAKKDRSLDVVPVLAPSVDVRKAVESIAIRPVAGKLTLLSRKIFNVLLKEAQHQGEDLSVYRISMSELVHDASFGSNDTQLIKDQLRKMNQTQVEWNTATPDGRRWGVTSFLSEAEIIETSNGRRSTIEWSYSPKIKKRLLAPDIYARLSLEFMSQLRSAASLALYEIAVRYSTSPNGLSMREPWGWWRPVLTGIPEKEAKTYLQYRYFKRDVLSPAIAEVNAITDVDIELIEHKNGRVIEEIQFRIRAKQQPSLALENNNLIDSSLIKRMESLGVTRRDIDQIYGEQDETFIRATLEYVEGRIKNKKLSSVSSPSAFFKNALKKRYAEPQAAAKADQDQKKLTEKKRLSKPELIAQFMAAKREEIRVEFDAMDADARSELIAMFEREQLPNEADTVRKTFLKSGLSSKTAETSFIAWMTKKQYGETSESDLLEFMMERMAG